MNKLTNKELKKLESIFTKIQRNIESGLNTLFITNPIRVAKVWKRDQGGGGKSISITGDTIEKPLSIFHQSLANNYLNRLLLKN